LEEDAAVTVTGSAPGPTTEPQTQSAASPAAAVGRARTRRILGWIALGLAVVLVITVAGGYLVYRHLNGNISHLPIVTGQPRPTPLNKAQNILLIGSDTRAFAGGAKFGAEVGGARSDTAILVHLSAGGRKAVMVSIPRDSYVEIPACRTATGTSTPHHDKFNAAYSIGGPSCTIATVESLTHIRIDHFVEVNFQGFQRMVNALGGVNICIRKPINDPIRFVAGHYMGSGLVLSTGTHTLQGKQALAFVRARYGVGDGSDIGRIKDQQLFISAVIRKATSAGLLVNIPALYGFLDAATKSIRTDPKFGLSQLKNLANRLHGLKPGTVSLLTVPFVTNTPGVPSADVAWDLVKAPALWDALRRDRPLPGQSPTPAAASSASPTPGSGLTIPPGAITVRVLNGTGEPGIAHRVAAELVAQGFHATAGNASARGVSTTVVRYGTNRSESSLTVAAAVKPSSRQLDPTLGNTVELLVGADFAKVVPVAVAPPPTSPAARPSPTPSLDITTADQNVCSA
jgi:LCP family protein required for cell wall assembly